VNDKNRNLLARALSALALLPVVLWLTWTGGPGFALLVAVGAGLAALELSRLPAIGAAARSGAGAAPGSGGGLRNVTGAAVATAVVAFLLPLVHEPAFHRALPQLSVEILLTALVLAALCDALFFELDLPLAPRRVGLAVLGAVWCGLPLSAIVQLRQLPHGEVWVLIALSLSFGNDTGAYFAGRAFGRRKLFPRISPSKTWEGAIGGSVASTLFACLFGGIWLPELPLWGAALVGLGGSILGPLGDLSESLFKRAYGAKDSGRIMPGHGGMFDRIDALLFISPFVLFCARHLTR
jgi:phosphatidate cytidylyltransferase